MNDEAAKSLREPFDARLVGKLPRITCKACSESRTKNCDKHSKSKCAECDNYITTAHMHLDYVGHAAVTDRLLAVDPEWTWDFKAKNEDGSPVVFTAGLADPFAKVGLWITLTIRDTTRPGFGEGKNFKEAIGDALRNAAMRFGVGLDLWGKEDLRADEHPAETNGPAPGWAEASNTLLELAQALGARAATADALERHHGDLDWVRQKIASAQESVEAKKKAGAVT